VTRLTVVIPSRDKAPLLARTLDALEAQTLPADEWNCVVVDDASRDGTADLLAARCGGWKDRLQVVRPPRNVGRAAARNLGAAAADGELLLFLDDDIVAPPGLLAAHRDLLADRPGWGTIGRVATDPELIDAGHFHYLDSRGVAKLPPGPVPARYFVTQNAAVPREAFRSVGGFDEEFSAYGFEDMEVAFRLEDRAGVRFLGLHDPVPIHVHHHTLADWTVKKIECGRSSLELLARLHPGRLGEMRLDLVVDPPGGPAAGPWRRLLRRAAAAVGVDPLTSIVASWPTGEAHRPLAFAAYARCCDLLVLSCYAKGLTSRRI